MQLNRDAPHFWNLPRDTFCSDQPIILTYWGWDETNKTSFLQWKCFEFRLIFLWNLFVGNLTIIVSDNGLLLGRRQAIIWNNAGILLMRPLVTNPRYNFNRNWNIFIQENAFENVVWKILSRPQYVTKNLVCFYINIITWSLWVPLTTPQSVVEGIMGSSNCYSIMWKIVFDQKYRYLFFIVKHQSNQILCTQFPHYLKA